MTTQKFKTLSGFRRRVLEPVVEDTQRDMLMATQGRPMFASSSGSKAHRRAKGKMAKRSRKLNRGR